jgi:hypothetical protein
MSDASRDANRVTTLLGASNLSVKTPVVIYADPTTHRLYVDSLTSGLKLPDFDYVSMTIAPAGTETYLFYTGGAGGTLVATIVIVYTDATRTDISTITKT